MQTRNPYDPSPVPVAKFVWKVADDGGARINTLPIEALLPNQAFTATDSGGMKILEGGTPSDDPVWEEYNGGIRLRM